MKKFIKKISSMFSVSPKKLTQNEELFINLVNSLCALDGTYYIDDISAIYVINKEKSLCIAINQSSYRVFNMKDNTVHDYSGIHVYNMVRDNMMSNTKFEIDSLNVMMHNANAIAIKNISNILEEVYEDGF